MTHDDTQTLLVAIVVVVALLAVAWILVRQRQSKHLQQRFGPEYGRVVASHGDRTKAEAELRARERRVERLKLVPLTPAEATRFGDEWRSVQTRFVDDPSGAVTEVVITSGLAPG